MARDYYQVLGVPKTADDKAIKSAFRKLARKLHPDVNPGNAKAEAEFKEVGEAYAVLSDPEKRKLYDRHGEHWEQAGQGGGFYGNPDGGQQMDIDFGGLFGNLFGFGGEGFGRGQVQQIQPRDVERAIDVTLDEIDKGTVRTLTFQTEDACGTCAGQGQVRLTGSGNRVGPCPTCRGTGIVPNSRKIVVTIPAGFQDGKKLRVPGGGAKGSNGKAGDLFVLVRVSAHAIFTRKGEDTEVDVSVPFTVAALGGQVSVPTPRASGKMNVPAGTQSGQMFRLKGQGVSKLGGGHGDLLARVKVSVPKTLTDAQRKLIEQLAELEEKP